MCRDGTRYTADITRRWNCTHLRGCWKAEFRADGGEIVSPPLGLVTVFLPARERVYERPERFELNVLQIKIVGFYVELGACISYDGTDWRRRRRKGAWTTTTAPQYCCTTNACVNW